jgi:hypothetical protein
MVNGTWIGVNYEVCGSGTSCTASDARSACSAVGKKVVSHASNGTSTVSSLGATASCNWSISYYTVDGSMSSSACLVGVSNLDWSGCCGTSRWHGNTMPFGSANSVFGYVQSSNSGYDGSYSGTSYSNWGCTPLASNSGTSSGCSTKYVACTN